MKRRWKQISLRSLLLLVLVCAVLLVLWTVYIQPYQQEQEVLAALEGKQFAYTSEAIARAGSSGWPTASMRSAWCALTSATT